MVWNKFYTCLIRTQRSYWFCHCYKLYCFYFQIWIFHDWYAAKHTINLIACDTTLLSSSRVWFTQPLSLDVWSVIVMASGIGFQGQTISVFCIKTFWNCKYRIIPHFDFKWHLSTKMNALAWGEIWRKSSAPQK